MLYALSSNPFLAAVFQCAAQLVTKKKKLTQVAIDHPCVQPEILK